MVTVREAVPDDYPRLEELSVECGKEPKWQNFVQDTAVDTFAPLQKQNSKLVLVAELSTNGTAQGENQDRELVGYLTADEYDPKEKKLALETVFVLKKYRRRGIASQLVSHFTQEWIGKGFAIHLYAVGTDAYQFFDHLGWRFRWAKMEKTSLEDAANKEVDKKDTLAEEPSYFRQVLPYFAVQEVFFLLTIGPIAVNQYGWGGGLGLMFFFTIVAAVVAPLIKLRFDAYNSYFNR